VNPYLVLLGVVAVGRVLELAISRRNARTAFARGAFEVGRRHYRVMMIFHTAFLLSCAAEVIWLRRPFPGTVGFAALAGVVLAQALRYWAIATLRWRWSTRVIVVPGAPPVTSGPYRFVRHPNYVAVILEVLLLPLVHGAWLTALVFSVGNAVLLRVRIRAEEEALGPSYADAFAGRRRFIP
jgi:methyltransferase